MILETQLKQNEKLRKFINYKRMIELTFAVCINVLCHCEEQSDAAIYFKQRTLDKKIKTEKIWDILLMKKSSIFDKTFFCFQRNVFSKFIKSVPLITHYEKEIKQK